MEVKNIQNVRNSDLSLKELFKDYSGESFQAKPLIFEPKGNENWGTRN